jgi:hypothetical protein
LTLVNAVNVIASDIVVPVFIARDIFTLVIGAEIVLTAANAVDDIAVHIVNIAVVFFNV